MLAIFVLGCLNPWVNAQDNGDNGDDGQVQKLYQQFEMQNAKRHFEQANATLAKALELKDIATLHYLRGRVRLRLGEFDASVKSFDAYVKAMPKAESRQWERGISMYYAKQYKRGAEQFELYLSLIHI